MFDLSLRQRKRNSAYRKLFLTENGALKPEAETVLNDLYDFTRFFKSVPPEPQSLALVEGGRQVVRHILKCAKMIEQEQKRQTNAADFKTFA